MTPRVLALVLDWNGPTAWRVLWPFNLLRRQGMAAWYLTPDDPRVPSALRQADVLVLPRWTWDGRYRDRLRAGVAQAHAAGAMVVGEFDDDVFSPASLPQTQLMGSFHGYAPAAIEADRQDRCAMLPLLDGVTVPNAQLAAVVRQYADVPVAVIPNAIHWAWWAERVPRIPRTDARLTIGWAGGARLDADLAPMLTAWARIAARYPAVQFRVAGYQPPAVAAAVPADRLHRAPWLPLDQYPRAYAHVDIGCCPLADNPFNRAKTPIKAWEWAAAGAAVVASPPVYGDVLRPGRDGYVVETAEAWEQALATLIEQPGPRQAMAARWAKRVRERHSLATQLYRWPEAYTALRQQWQQRAA